MMLRRKRAGKTANIVSDETNDTDDDDDDDDDEAVILLEVQPSGLQKRRRKKKQQQQQHQRNEQRPRMMLRQQQQPTPCGWWTVLVLVVAVVTIVGAILAFVIYKIRARNYAEEQFRKDFKIVANRCTETFLKEMRNAVSIAKTMAAAVSMNSELLVASPNITIPYFDNLAAGVVASSLLFKPIFSPLIQNSKERFEWEAYAQQQLADSADACNMCGSRNFTIETDSTETGDFCEAESLRASYGIYPRPTCPNVVYKMQSRNCRCRPVKTDDASSLPPVKRGWMFNDSHKPQIYTLQEGRPVALNGSSPGPFWPVWQVEPFRFEISESMMMYDLASDPVTQNTFKEMIRQSLVPVTSPLMSRRFDDQRRHFWDAYFSQDDHYWSQRSLLVVPVVWNSNSTTTTTTSTPKLVGSLVFGIHWPVLLGIPHPHRWDTNVITIVMESSCGKQTSTCTFQSDAFSGIEGDKHDGSYSNMVVETFFTHYRDLMYLSLPLPRYDYDGTSSDGDESKSTAACYYRIRVYPTISFHSQYYASHMSLPDFMFILVFSLVAFVMAVVAGHCYMTRRCL